MASRNAGLSDKAQAELRSSRKRIDELTADLTKLTSQVI
jgi:hypothetical protein